MHEIAVDLAERWRRARCAALRATWPDEPVTASEAELLPRALEHAAEDVLRRVFDVSLRLGEGFRRYHRLDLPLGDLVAFLPLLGTPCAARTWSLVDHEPAFLGTRSGCPAAPLHARACDYWREAQCGLVLGMTSAVRHARHASVGHGASTCVDVLYVYPQSPLRFGTIPEALREGLEAVRRSVSAFDSSLRVEFLGVAENVLYYRCTRTSDGDVRGSGAIEAGVARRFPWLVTRDVSPRPVLTDDPA